MSVSYTMDVVHGIALNEDEIDSLADFLGLTGLEVKYNESDVDQIERSLRKLGVDCWSLYFRVYADEVSAGGRYSLVIALPSSIIENDARRSVGPVFDKNITRMSEVKIDERELESLNNLIEKVGLDHKPETMLAVRIQ